jgi:hypothetical protein
MEHISKNLRNNFQIFKFLQQEKKGLYIKGKFHFQIRFKKSNKTSAKKKIKIKTRKPEMNTIFKALLAVLVFTLLVDWIQASPIQRSNELAALDENRYSSPMEESEQAAVDENNRRLNAAYFQLLNLQQKKYPMSQQAYVPMSGNSNDEKFIKSILETLAIFGAKSSHQTKNVASKDFFGKK